MLREVERECCVSHAPEGRKYTDRADRQTDIYIYMYIHSNYTLSSVLCYCEQSRSSRRAVQAQYRVPPTALSSFFFAE
jgi:hypothetical protein